jgi:hypothetical protein
MLIGSQETRHSAGTFCPSGDTYILSHANSQGFLLSCVSKPGAWLTADKNGLSWGDLFEAAKGFEDASHPTGGVW